MKILYCIPFPFEPLALDQLLLSWRVSQVIELLALKVSMNNWKCHSFSFLSLVIFQEKFVLYMSFLSLFFQWGTWKFFLPLWVKNDIWKQQAENIFNLGIFIDSLIIKGSSGILLQQVCQNLSKIAWKPYSNEWTVRDPIKVRNGIHFVMSEDSVEQ